MDIAVFLGQSLQLDAARMLLPQATFYPPLSADSLEWLADAPHTHYLVIDGDFEPGCLIDDDLIRKRVEYGGQWYGAAGFGAYLASQLSVVGFRGLGLVFDAYNTNAISGWEDVARAYDTDFSPLNDSLYSIRCTVAHAYKTGVISRFFAIELILQTVEQVYYRRDFQAIAAAVAVHYGDMGEDFLNWLAQHGVNNIEQIDVIDALRHIAIQWKAISMQSAVVSTVEPV